MGARVQSRLIQGIRSGDGVGKDKDTIASIRYYFYFLFFLILFYF